MSFIDQCMAVIEFATLFAASAFFAWASESWKDTTKLIFLMLSAFVFKVAVNEVTFANFGIARFDQWTPLTWGTLGLFLGAVSGALLRTFRLRPR